MSGRRNEDARSRRRNWLKKELSLTSVVRSEHRGARREEFTLENHFGWHVLQRTQIGDGTFPYFLQHLEKPDIQGRDFEKATYVLFVDKGVTVERKTSFKNTQTVVSQMQVEDKHPHVPVYDTPRTKLPKEESRERTPKKEESKKKKPKKDDKKNRLISEFYYVPLRERSQSNSRSRSRERKGGDSDADSVLPIHSTDELEERVVMAQDDFEGKKRKTKKKVKSAEKIVEKASKQSKGRGRGPEKWQLRAMAGADHAEGSDETIGPISNQFSDVSENVSKNSSNLVSKLKFDTIKFMGDGPSAHLLETASGTNQYLFVSGKK